jgi:hypothetical protein
MKAPRYTASRQKSCLSCSNAKAKCDRKAGRCTRCSLRGSSCIYPHALPPTGSASSARDKNEARESSSLSASNTLLPDLECELPVGSETRSSIVESTQSVGGNSLTDTFSTTSTGGHVPKDTGLNVTSLPTEKLDTLDFSGLELFCPINAGDISNRWLNSYVPMPGQKIKEYPASITAFIYRTLKSYAALTVRGRDVPPFVHTSQMMTGSTRPPLSTCLTLVRMCEKPLPGSESVTVEVLQREMNSLYEQHGAYDDMALLAAFQAYLIYSMILFFKFSLGSSPFLRQAIMRLQELACASSQQGLMCVAEQQRARPRWESWISAEAKRRTLFAMYLFDSVLAAQDGVPSFLGTELQGLLAPSNQFLWRAHTRHEWELTYNIHLVDWVEGGLHIDELWPIADDLDELGLLQRRNRVDQWLEGIDESGTLIYAVTSCTHGG